MLGINSCRRRKQTSTTEKQANEQKNRKSNSNYEKLLRGGYIQKFSQNCLKRPFRLNIQDFCDRKLNVSHLASLQVLDERFIKQQNNNNKYKGKKEIAVYS